MSKKVLVTGWAGFIGSNFVRYLLKNTDWEICGMDCETYAARPLWVEESMKKPDHRKRFKAVEPFNSDIRVKELCDAAIRYSEPEIVFHLAAESHVCRSIEGPGKFVDTNIMGTFNLLEAVREYAPKAKFVHVSTDEVFGEAEGRSLFSESTPYRPRSPYAASKASSDFLVRSYHETYGLDTRITNCSNNYGPNQHPEKLVPKAILKALRGEPMTVYYPGNQVRDWIWVDDHCHGILKAATHGKPGEQYLFGGSVQMTNIEMIKKIWSVMDKAGLEPKKEFHLTQDRPTDDKRYAVDSGKAERELGWTPQASTSLAIAQTVDWYRKHEL